MSIDFNNADPQRGFDLIPAGTIVRAVGTIRPGGKSRPGMEAVDANWLTSSKSSDVLYLSFEFVVTDGPFKNRKWWQNMTVAGGEVDEKGNSKAFAITGSTFRAMLNSARNVSPDDVSEAALSARRIETWGDLSPIEFLCKVNVRKGSGNYQDQNQIGTVIEPGNKLYVAPGQAVAPSGFAPAPAAASAPTPAWAASKPPASAPTAATPAWAR